MSKKHFGYCIYCGKSNVFLTDEHAIPDAISGQHILAKASCSKCQKVINRFEQRYLRNSLGLSRAYLKLKRSRKAKRAPVTSTVSGEKKAPEEVMVQFVTVVPRHLPWVERGSVEDLSGSFDSVVLQSLTGWQKRQPDIVPSFRVDDTYRFIAKVAYGLTHFNYQLPFKGNSVADYILTGDGDFRMFIGGSRAVVRDDKLHSWSYDRIKTGANHITPKREYLRIRLNLFSQFSD